MTDEQWGHVMAAVQNDNMDVAATYRHAYVYSEQWGYPLEKFRQWILEVFPGYEKEVKTRMKSRIGRRRNPSPHITH